LGKRRILGRSYTGRIAAPIVIAEEPVFGGGVEGASDHFAATLANEEVGSVKTIGLEASGTGVHGTGLDDLAIILSPSYERFDGLRLFVECSENQVHCLISLSFFSSNLK
jgi:hypothetical protein